MKNHESFTPQNFLRLRYQQTSKMFLKHKFEEWYAEVIFKELTGPYSTSDRLDPVDLPLPVMKELCSKRILEMFEYISANSQMIVKGFVWAGISKALDEEPSSTDSVSDLARWCH